MQLAAIGVSGVQLSLSPDSRPWNCFSFRQRQASPRSKSVKLGRHQMLEVWHLHFSTNEKIGLGLSDRNGVRRRPSHGPMRLHERLFRLTHLSSPSGASMGCLFDTSHLQALVFLRLNLSLSIVITLEVWTRRHTLTMFMVGPAWRATACVGKDGLGSAGHAMARGQPLT